jgi:hypothetical protein
MGDMSEPRDYSDLEKRLRDWADAAHQQGDSIRLEPSPNFSAEMRAETKAGFYAQEMLLTEAAAAIAELTKRADSLEALCDAFARNFQQREYPCSPHCAGYLRERAAQLGVGLSRDNPSQRQLARDPLPNDPANGDENAPGDAVKRGFD